jgi:hypothetical protein
MNMQFMKRGLERDKLRAIDAAGDEEGDEEEDRGLSFGDLLATSTQVVSFN